MPKQNCRQFRGERSLRKLQAFRRTAKTTRDSMSHNETRIDDDNADRWRRRNDLDRVNRKDQAAQLAWIHRAPEPREPLPAVPRPMPVAGDPSTAGRRPEPGIIVGLRIGIPSRGRIGAWSATFAWQGRRRFLGRIAGRLGVRRQRNANAIRRVRGLGTIDPNTGKDRHRHKPEGNFHGLPPFVRRVKKTGTNIICGQGILGPCVSDRLGFDLFDVEPSCVALGKRKLTRSPASPYDETTLRGPNEGKAPSAGSGPEGASHECRQPLSWRFEADGRRDVAARGVLRDHPPQ
jgi:hypothetical protein